MPLPYTLVPHMALHPPQTQCIAPHRGLIALCSPGFQLMQSEGSFSNPNGIVAARVNAWLTQELTKLTGTPLRLLELCSGCGNHTVGLSSCYTEALCIEIDGKLCEDAVCNMEANGLSSRVTVVKGDIRHTRKILHEAWGAELHGEQLLTIVDPPRQGLVPEAVDVLMDVDFKVVVYVACGIGLQKDLPRLLTKYKVDVCSLADHFPYTHFVEVVCILTKQ
jgi:tRNA/tmRNA/rRNA uracil-C5-methylase (TrmA/RlmC/RlmD family)